MKFGFKFGFGAKAGDPWVNLIPANARQDCNQHSVVNGVIIVGATEITFPADATGYLGLTFDPVTVPGTYRLAWDAWVGAGTKDHRINLFITGIGDDNFAVQATTVQTQYSNDYVITQANIDAGLSPRVQNDAVGVAGNMFITDFDFRRVA